MYLPRRDHDRVAGGKTGSNGGGSEILGVATHRRGRRERNEDAVSLGEGG